MAKKRLRSWIKISLTAAVLAVLGVSVTTFTQTGGKKEVLFLAKSSDSAFWQAAFQGAQAAANEYNVKLIIRAPQTEDDYLGQNVVLEWAATSGVEAVVFSACDYDRSVEAAQGVINAGIPVISVDSPIRSDKVQTMIGTDNEEAGRQAAREIARITGGRAKVGIVNCERTGAVGIQRESGFLEVVAEYPEMEVVDIRYTISDVEDPRNNTLDMLEKNPEINAIASFNEWSTLGVGEALELLGTEPGALAVVGFDSNIKSVEQLESGVMDALVVQNPFAMGYIGVEQAIGYRRARTHEAFIDTGTKVITLENMFNTENQKLLFLFSE